MLYRPFTETKTVATALTWGAAKQTISFKIPQSRRRLEGVMLEFVILTAGTAPTFTSDGFDNICSEIRLKVNDVLGSRNAIQAPSTVLIGFDRDNGAKQNRFNTLGQRAVTAAKNYRVFVPCMLRIASVAEPIGNILGIPLDQVNEDLTCEIDIAPNSDCASANPSVSIPLVRATILYRDVDPSVKYLPTEFVATKWTLAGTGKQSFDVSNGGFLTNLTLDCYSTDKTVRSSLFTANDHELQLDLGSNALLRYFPTHMDYLLDRQTGIIPPATPFFGDISAVDTSATDVTIAGSLLGHYCMDYLFDNTIGGALSPASMLNANTIPLGGDKVKVTGTNFSAAGIVYVTAHKFLTRSPDDLKALVGA